MDVKITDLFRKLGDGEERRPAKRSFSSEEAASIYKAPF